MTASGRNHKDARQLYLKIIDVCAADECGDRRDVHKVSQREGSLSRAEFSTALLCDI